MTVGKCLLKIVVIAIILMGVQDSYHNARTNYQSGHRTLSIIFWFYCAFYLVVIYGIIFIL